MFNRHSLPTRKRESPILSAKRANNKHPRTTKQTATHIKQIPEVSNKNKGINNLESIVKREENNTSKDCIKKLLFFQKRSYLFIIPTLLNLKKQKLSHKTIIYNTVTRNICHSKVQYQSGTN